MHQQLMATLLLPPVGEVPEALNQLAALSTGFSTGHRRGDTGDIDSLVQYDHADIVRTQMHWRHLEALNI